MVEIWVWKVKHGATQPGSFFFFWNICWLGADGTPWDNSDEDLIRVRTYSEVDQMVYPLVMTNIAIENGHL